MNFLIKSQRSLWCALIVLGGFLLAFVSAEAHTLTPAQVAVLTEFQRVSSFPIHVLEKEVMGLPRTLVLLGESHRVKEPVSAAARELISEFHWIGTEGVRGDEALSRELETSYWLAKFMFSEVVGSSPGVIQMAQSRFNSQFQGMSELSKHGFKLLYGAESVTHSRISELQGMSRDLILGLGYDESAELKDPSELTCRLISYLGRSGHVVLEQLEFLEPAPEAFSPWRDSFVSYMQTLKTGCKVGACVVGGTIAAALLGWDRAAEVGIVGGAVGAGLFYRDLALKSFDAQKKLVEMQKQRNQILARQMGRAFELKSQLPTFLAVVGMAHLEGLLPLLRDQGFVETEWRGDRP